MSKALEVKKLNKFFGKKQVLHDVSFDIEEGEILGFIGPNGAGKTTTIKLILGLQSISSGEVYIDGFNIKKDFSKAIASVGAIVESPDLYMYLTGRQNLKLMSSYYNGISKEDIEEVIKLVGLENRIDDKVSKYSLGMRQRLGIAASLLNKPKLLILDEPTNGLDPEGIKEMRELLKNLAKKKIAVLISSHNLSELESFITTACVIQNGKVISTSSVKKLKQKSTTTFKIDLNTTKGIDKVLKDNYEIIDEDSIELYVEKEEITKYIKKLIDNKYEIYQVVKEELSLEEAFIQMTGGNKID
ncbi:MAG: ABC transporter ATP-binding protein [Firmicutes bacterium]|nr:ABC transporter ATP-binding protein [Bacillota bacterium]